MTIGNYPALLAEADQGHARARNHDEPASVADIRNHLALMAERSPFDWLLERLGGEL